MNHRCGEIDVSHPLATHTRVSHLDATAVTDDSLVFDALVFSTRAFPVSLGTEDAFAEESIFLRTVGPVVDGFRLPDLTL